MCSSLVAEDHFAAHAYVLLPLGRDDPDRSALDQVGQLVRYNRLSVGVPSELFATIDLLPVSQVLGVLQLVFLNPLIVPVSAPLQLNLIDKHHVLVELNLDPLVLVACDSRPASSSSLEVQTYAVDIVIFVPAR